MNVMDVLKQEYHSFRELEEGIEQLESRTQRGDAFEQFCYFYLSYHRDLYQIREIYSPKIPGREVPEAVRRRLRLSARDDGVDGVYTTWDGRYTAWQSKFRSGRKSPSGNELNDFWAEAEYADHRLVMANCMTLPKDADKRKNSGSILADQFDSLDGDFFCYLRQAASGTEVSLHRERLTPMPFQREMIEAAAEGFRHVNRGKIIAACGTGKTLVSLWISERLDSERVLFFAPNLSLVRQSIARWTRNASRPFVYLAVCSDETVGDGVDDAFVTDVSALDVPVTTDPAAVRDFLLAGRGKQVVFSTYQSAPCIAAGIREIPGFRFDFVVYDEAHRTAGSKESGLFSLSLQEGQIPAEKRLFMTATQRLVKPWVKDRLAREDITVFSMDDEEIYGPVFYQFPFGEAIRQKIIADYRIVIGAVTDGEIAGMIGENRYLRLRDGSGRELGEMSADDAFKACLLGKAVKELGLKKVVSFHSTLAAARAFARFYQEAPEDFLWEQFGIDKEEAVFLHVNGSMAAGERSLLFTQFEQAGFGLLTNVRCLTEGVDIPLIDSVLFADPKGSMIDIVQAVGRALRKPAEERDRTAYILIPVRVREDGSCVEDDFAPLHCVIQALRDQDDTLAEWIDQLNLGVVRGKRGFGGRGGGRIQLLLPASVDGERFARELSVRIATVNARQAGAAGLGSRLGKKQRGSDYKRVFKCIGDYNYDKYRDSLVMPTLERFGGRGEPLSRRDLVINNNNVSHSQRLGVIRKTGANSFCLTPLGRTLGDGDISFENLFVNQMMLYGIEEGEDRLYPYRMMVRLLLACGSLHYIEFLFGPYSIRAGGEERELKKALDIIQMIREEYPNVLLTSEGNREEVGARLNQLRGTSFSQRDIWTDRTTTGNQYRFMLNHLSLLDGCFLTDWKKKVIRVSEDGRPRLEQMLEKSRRTLGREDYEYGAALWLPGSEETV